MIIMYEHLMMLKIIMIEICHLVVFFFFSIVYKMSWV